jgi:hemoglobin/transferrin/lactoferrin receptor protein
MIARARPPLLAATLIAFLPAAAGAQPAPAAPPLASVPAHRVTFSGGWRFPESGVTVGGRWQIVDTQDRVPAGTPETSGYGVLDLFATWVPTFAQNIRFDAGIDNVFDQAYRRSTWNSTPAPTYYEIGRNVRASMRVSF